MEVDVSVSDNAFEDIIKSLVHNTNIIFKSQQIGENDLDASEKTEIANKLFQENKLNFLLKFGDYLTIQDLRYFEQFTKEDNEPAHFEDIEIILKQLVDNAIINQKDVNIKNKRYLALQQLIEDDSYFSEVEMMKRNPLLYDQLVGQYLSADEKKERDKYMFSENITLTKILLEGIDRDEAEQSKKHQSQQEDDQMEESDSSEDDMAPVVDKTTRWGEFEEDKKIRKPMRKVPHITASERSLLKEEFVTTMYQNFLDGKDADFFDYSVVDEGSRYNTIEMERDAEDKYFDSEDIDVEEEPKESKVERNDSSEDELDIYMKALNQHPTVCELADNIKDKL